MISDMSEDVKKKRPYLVVTLPVHNEVDLLESAVRSVMRELSNITDDYLIVIAEDGSTDGTLEKAIELSRSDPRIICFHSDRRLGRGRSLIEVWGKVDGEIFIYLDSDLATDMRFFPELIKGIEMGYDLVTGSRYLPESRVERPILRKIVSKIYNLVMRILFHTEVHDHQCGFKAFSRRLIHHVLPKCRSTHWFWDSEIITLAASEGYQILEIPIAWKEKRRRRTPLRRLFNDIMIHGLGIIRLWFRIKESRENLKIRGGKWKR